ncbi:MAG: peptidyl-prolyl cis-trans isomerase [Myxococcales bacterium]|nr:peptidyl-prolyl cis-trans isomerase [Myxococcales bacterium]
MRRIVTPLLGVILAACGPSEGGSGPSLEGARVRGSAQVGGEVVATVDGHPITRAEVEAAARAGGVRPTVALRRLEDELILALAAERHASVPDPSVRRAMRQAEVQALLARTVEASEAAIDPARLEEAYAENPGRFVAPEERRSCHVLAVVPPGIEEPLAEAWIREVVAELEAAPDPVAEALSIRRRRLDQLPFEVVVQEVVGLTRENASDQAYVDALFSLPTEGVVPHPVRSEQGWHAIVLTRIEPARHTPRADALAILRDEAVARHRAGELEQLEAEIAHRTPRFLAPNLPQLLSLPGITESAP